MPRGDVVHRAVTHLLCLKSHLLFLLHSVCCVINVVEVVYMLEMSEKALPVLLSKCAIKVALV